MSSLVDGQLRQLGQSLLEVWDLEDVRLLGQAGRAYLQEIQSGLRRRARFLDELRLGDWELCPHHPKVDMGREVYVQLYDEAVIHRCAGPFEFNIVKMEGVNFFRERLTDEENVYVFFWNAVRSEQVVPSLVRHGDSLFESSFWLTSHQHQVETGKYLRRRKY